jgi:hypothetical protein
MGYKQNPETVHIDNPSIESLNDQLAEMTTKFDNNLSYKGFAITTNATLTSSWLDTNLPKIKACGASLQVVTGVSVQNSTDSNPVDDTNLSANMSLISQKCTANGVSISMLKPHIMLPNYNDSFDRSGYAPSNTTTFFTAWGNILNSYANLCNQYNIPILSLTCETTNLVTSNYVSNWTTIINNIRTTYPNLKLTIAFKRSELATEIDNFVNSVSSVCSLLDIISLNVYPTLNRKSLKRSVYDLPTLTSGGETFPTTGFSIGYVEMLNKASRNYGKDVMVTETGCTYYSNASANSINPILFDGSKPTDHIDQNTFLDTVISVFDDVQCLKGIFIWNANDPAFGFIGSSAETTIKKYWGVS